MPNRILRDGILASESVATLSWAEEVFYRRLMSVVDDHGRFHSAPKLIRAACYPLLIDKVSDADIGKWLTACVEAALVSVYPALDGKRYIQIIKFGQQVRAKSRFPEPSDACLPASDISCDQVLASAHLVGVGVEGVISKASPSHPPAGGLAAGFDEFWTAWPRGERKQDKAKCLDNWKRNCLGAVAAVILADVRIKRGTQKWRDGYIEAPLVYLHGKRWQGGVEPNAAPSGPPVTVPSDAPEKTAAYLAEQAAHAALAAPPPDLDALKNRLAVARAA